jgi:hypothetical protein
VLTTKTATCSGDDCYFAVVSEFCHGETFLGALT